MNGTYSVSGSGGNVVTINNSGTASAPITYEAAPGQSPIIDTTGQWTGIYDNGASYVTVKGFNVTGNAASITLAYAQSQASNSNNPLTSATGIDVESGATHVIIENNQVHDQGGNGIQASGSDYISILNNTVYDNAWWSPFANSGISVFKMSSSDSNTTGYKIIISGNTVYGNQEYIPWHTQGQITDGNGIIVDSNNMTGYNGRTLVENNALYDNGGTGAHAFDSNNVDFFYNTAYDNNQSSALNEGQIVGQQSNNVRIENNIMVAPAGKIVDGYTNGYSVTYDYNVYSGTGGEPTLGAHDIVANPMFVSPTTGNFNLAAGSPAIGNSNSAFTVATDILGNARPATGADRGAYETGGATPTPTPTPAPTPKPTPTPTPAPTPTPSSTSTNDTVVLHLSADVWNGPPEFLFTVDGKQQGGVQSVTALHNLGQSEAFTFQGNFGAGQHVVGIQFINDAWGHTPTTDRNIYVNSISYNGVTMPNTTAIMWSNGTDHFTV